jgi:hypothetical protein
VKLSEVLPSYRESATRALRNTRIAPSTREIVRRYFEALATVSAK